MSDGMGDLEIQVNGAARVVPAGTTVGQLLDTLGLRRDGIAVAVGLQVVPRGAHDARVLAAGDKVEIIQAVGGG
jgi:sulfur carrier protein